MTLMPDEKPERYGEGKVNLNSPKKVVCLEHLSARRFYIFPFLPLKLELNVMVVFSSSVASLEAKHFYGDITQVRTRK